MVSKLSVPGAWMVSTRKAMGSRVENLDLNRQGWRTENQLHRNEIRQPLREGDRRHREQPRRRRTRERSRSPSYDFEGRKLEIPVFDGEEDAYGWVISLEKHFQERGTPEKEKLKKAVTALRGGALKWWHGWDRSQPRASWIKFMVALLRRFKPEYRNVLPILDGDDDFEPEEPNSKSKDEGREIEYQNTGGESSHGDPQPEIEINIDQTMKVLEFARVEVPYIKAVAKVELLPTQITSYGPRSGTITETVNHRYAWEEEVELPEKWVGNEGFQGIGGGRSRSDDERSEGGGRGSVVEVMDNGEPSPPSEPPDRDVPREMGTPPTLRPPSAQNASMAEVGSSHGRVDLPLSLAAEMKRGKEKQERERAKREFRRSGQCFSLMGQAQKCSFNRICAEVRPSSHLKHNSGSQQVIKKEIVGQLSEKQKWALEEDKEQTITVTKIEDLNWASTFHGWLNFVYDKGKNCKETKEGDFEPGTGTELLETRFCFRCDNSGGTAVVPIMFQIAAILAGPLSSPSLIQSPELNCI